MRWVQLLPAPPATSPAPTPTAEGTKREKRRPQRTLWTQAEHQLFLDGTRQHGSECGELLSGRVTSVPTQPDISYIPDCADTLLPSLQISGKTSRGTSPRAWDPPCARRFLWHSGGSFRLECATSHLLAVGSRQQAEVRLAPWQVSAERVRSHVQKYRKKVREQGAEAAKIWQR
jgi:hypothetical protein